MSDIEIFIDGQPRRVPAGVSVAAALIVNDQVAWRQTRGGRPRGMFCGIGVCFDCLVMLNGVADVRACIVEVRAGDRIDTAVNGAN